MGGCRVAWKRRVAFRPLQFSRGNRHRILGMRAPNVTSSLRAAAGRNTSRAWYLSGLMRVPGAVTDPRGELVCRVGVYYSSNREPPLPRGVGVLNRQVFLSRKKGGAARAPSVVPNSPRVFACVPASGQESVCSMPRSEGLLFAALLGTGPFSENSGGEPPLPRHPEGCRLEQQRRDLQPRLSRNPQSGGTAYPEPFRDRPE